MGLKYQALLRTIHLKSQEGDLEQKKDWWGNWIKCPLRFSILRKNEH